MNSMDHSYSVLSGSLESNEPSPEYMFDLDRIICEFMREQDIPGASLSISYCGNPFYKQGYGIARCGQRVSSDAYYRIASISKVVTAIGVLRLVETEQLHLNSKVFGSNGILSEFTCHQQHQTDITVLHLLQHSAGWDRDSDGDHVFWYSDPTHSLHVDAFDDWALVQYVLTHRLAFKPGSKHAYSNLTYKVLGMIIERTSGILYGEFMMNMLDELDIHMYVGKTLQEQCNSFLEVKYFNNSKQCTEKSIYSKGCEVSPQYGSFPMENSGSYGGLVTSADNLVKLLNSLVMSNNYKRVLSSSSVEQMLAKPSYIISSDDWYGLGLDVEDCGQSFGHTGAMDGISTTVHHDKSGFTWALLCNSWAKDMDLDGVVKYALSTVQGYSLWQGMYNRTCVAYNNTEWCLTSQDSKQHVSIHVPYSRILGHALEMKSKDYEPSYISAVMTDREIKFVVIWNQICRKLKNTWSLIMDVKQAELSKFVEKLCKSKQSVNLCQSYIMNDEIHHMFIVSEKEDLSQRVYCVEEKGHIEYMEVYSGLGLTLCCQCVVCLRGAVYVTALYKNLQLQGKQKQTPLIQDQWTGLPVDKLVSSLQEKFEQQYRLDYLQFYSLEDKTYVSAVWTQMTITKNAFQRHVVYQRYNVSKYGLLYELRDSLNRNQPVKCLCCYVDEDVVYFVCIWGRYCRTKSCNISQRKKRF